ncbi:MAG: site-2 protease family protein [Proteobacteria bacterium]|nr:site-2 protease family protein [Pseudomonadota bacterium]
MPDPNQLVLAILTAGPMFLFALVFHEYCHALVAHRLGDQVAAWTGRLTMNPKVHLDPLGSVAMPVIGLVLGWLGGFAFIFGWARPVPFNPRDLADSRRDSMLIALAGPLANFVLVLVFALLIRALVGSGMGIDSPVLQIAAYGVYINALLGVFNLVPLPPLDGSKVLAFFLGPSLGCKLLALPPVLCLIGLLLLVTRGLIVGPLMTALGWAEQLAGAPLGMMLF